MKTKLFQRTFEESLQLEKDQSLKFVDDWESGTVYTHGLTIGNVVKRFLGVTLMYLLCYGGTYFALSLIKKDAFPIWTIMFSILYFVSIVIIFRSYFISPEKYMMKYNKDMLLMVVTPPTMIWIFVFGIVLLYKDFGMVAVIFQVVTVSVLLVLLTVDKVKGLSRLMDGRNSPSRVDKVGKNVFISVTSFFLIFGYLWAEFSDLRGGDHSITGEEKTNDVGGELFGRILMIVGPVFLWIATLHGVLTRIVQGYYVHKYPEQYRKHAGKTVEDWYGDKYIKKHPEILEQAQREALSIKQIGEK